MILLFYAYGWMTGVHHHIQLLFVEMGSSELFAQAGLQLRSIQALLPK
jgi:hypothetical protein